MRTGDESLRESGLRSQGEVRNYRTRTWRLVSQSRDPRRGRTRVGRNGRWGSFRTRTGIFETGSATGAPFQSRLGLRIGGGVGVPPESWGRVVGDQPTNQPTNQLTEITL